jgi:D-3-phosphoglycerate dehydrogenase
VAGLSIFSTHPLDPGVTEALRRIGDYRIASSPAPAAILAESAGAEIIVVRAPIPEAVVAREAGLRALIRHGAGLDMIPVAAATAAGVLVANVPGVNAASVAEHAIWTAMALLRRYPQVNRDLRGAGWEAGRAHADAGAEIGGLVLGALGMGAVGRALAGIARGGFGMRVLAHTRSPGTVPDGVEAVPLDRLMAEADVLVLCCPLTEATRGLIDAAALARMKPGAVLVNVARGAVVVEPALAAALAEGRLAGAALDVFGSQPLAPEHPFFALPNVILTPHLAGITGQSMRRMGEGVVAEAGRIAAGGLSARLVNPEAVDGYRRRFG